MRLIKSLGRLIRSAIKLACQRIEIAYRKAGISNRTGASK